SKLVDLANIDYNDNYLFGGTQTDITPFSFDSGGAGGVAYSGNDKALQAKLSEISNMDISVTGEDLRNTEAGDLFKILQDTADAIRSDDSSAINTSIDKADEALSHVIDLAAKLGNNINRMDFLDEQLKGHAIDMEGEVSQLTDTDYIEAFSAIQKYETTYAAALSVHAKIIQTSLLDFL
ncbi:MAG TPA: flagellin, partial [Balneolaceae bacterium]|nr:flagellin [Balneolaceae bacterium]